MAPRFRNGRPQTPGFDAIQSIQPAGLPGSTYVRPMDSDGGASNFLAVAEALGGLSSNLFAYSSRQKAGEAAAAAAQRQLERENASDARATSKEMREAAEFADKQMKDEADSMPWETMDLPALQDYVEKNDTPNGNSFGLKKAAVIAGQKIGKDYADTVLREAYKKYDPSSGMTLNQFMNEEVKKYLDDNLPMSDKRNWYYRKGFDAIVAPVIADIEKQEATFQKDKGKVLIEEGAAANAAAIVSRGKDMKLPAKQVASEFLSSWGSLRADAQGSRARPEFLGADVHTKFKTAVEALAEQGDYELVNEIVNQQAPGLASSLIKGPDSKWATEQLAKAKTKSIETQQEQSWTRMSNYDVLAEKGELEPRILEADPALKPEDKQRLLTKSKIAEAQRVERAKTAAAKTEAEQGHIAAKDSRVSSILSRLMTDGGGTWDLEDIEVPSKDGTGTTTFTVEQQREAVIARWEQGHRAKVAEIALTDPEKAKQYDTNATMQFFTNNSDLVNKKWKALFSGVNGAASIEVLAGTGQVPKNLQEAARVYSTLPPNLATQYVTDERSRLLLEAYKTAKEKASAYDGGGTFTEEQAWMTVTDMAKRLNADPTGEIPRIRWNDTKLKSLDQKIMTIGQTIGGFDKAIASPDMRSEVQTRAGFYYAAGLDEAEAIEKAVTEVSADYVQVNGDHLVNVKGVKNREQFVDFMNDTIAETVQQRSFLKGPNDPSADVTAYQPVKIGNAWVLKNGPSFANDEDGNLIKITPDDFIRWKDRKTEELARLAAEEADGKYSIPELIANGLLNAENRDKFWDYKKKWDERIAKEKQWEYQRRSRDGEVATGLLDTDGLVKAGREAWMKNIKVPEVNTNVSTNIEPASNQVSARLTGADVDMPTLLKAVIRAESQGIPTAESPKGALGLMQLMPNDGAVDAARALGMTDYLEADPLMRKAMLRNPEINKRLGTEYLNQMLTRYDGDVEKALVGYNWGPGNADKWDGKMSSLPDETRKYLKKILPYVESTAGGADVPAGDFNGPTGQTKLRYANSGAVRNRRVTPELETKLDRSVAAVFGKGYTVEIFSGGQAQKGEKGARRGSTRHDDHGHGGRAADVYIYGPDGKRVTNHATLMRLRNFWLSRGMGSAGTFMAGGGMHLDELTQDELGPGQGISWNY